MSVSCMLAALNDSQGLTLAQPVPVPVSNGPTGTVADRKGDSLLVTASLATFLSTLKRTMAMASAAL